MPKKKADPIIKTTLRLRRDLWAACRIAAIQEGKTLGVWLDEVLTAATRKGGSR